MAKSAMDSADRCLYIALSYFIHCHLWVRRNRSTQERNDSTSRVNFQRLALAWWLLKKSEERSDLASNSIWTNDIWLGNFHTYFLVEVLYMSTKKGRQYVRIAFFFNLWSYSLKFIPRCNETLPSNRTGFASSTSKIWLNKYKW